MNAVLEQISKIGIVPVVKIDNAADALPLAKALCAGGLKDTVQPYNEYALDKAEIEIPFPQMDVHMR